MNRHIFLLMILFPAFSVGLSWSACADIPVWSRRNGFEEHEIRKICGRMERRVESLVGSTIDGALLRISLDSTLERVGKPEFDVDGGEVIHAPASLRLWRKSQGVRMAVWSRMLWRASGAAKVPKTLGAPYWLCAALDFELRRDSWSGGRPPSADRLGVRALVLAGVTPSSSDVARMRMVSECHGEWELQGECASTLLESLTGSGRSKVEFKAYLSALAAGVDSEEAFAILRGSATSVADLSKPMGFESVFQLKMRSYSVNSYLPLTVEGADAMFRKGLEVEYLIGDGEGGDERRSGKLMDLWRDREKTVDSRAVALRSKRIFHEMHYITPHFMKVGVDGMSAALDVFGTEEFPVAFDRAMAEFGVGIERQRRLEDFVNRVEAERISIADRCGSWLAEPWRLRLFEKSIWPEAASKVGRYAGWASSRLKSE